MCNRNAALFAAVTLVSVPAWASDDAPLETATATSADLKEAPLTEPVLSDYAALRKLESETEIEDVLVTATRRRAAARADVVRSRDLLLRPRRRAADLLEVTPGLKVVQHSGGGKANQYFIRGFDADHGTDLALSMDGVPVNMVSHGHGQGYADLHFVIPEIIDRIEVKKGPYFAELGDFATAGAVNLVTKKAVSANSVSLAGGMFNTLRGLAVVSPQLGNESNLLAGEVYATDGPFLSGENLKRFNLLGKSGFDILGGNLTLTLTGYGADWDASGQVPDREVRAGRLDRFGSIDPTEGGASTRYNGYARFEKDFEDARLVVTGYVSKYRLQLFSNFTFFSRDPENGDMIEQIDDRYLGGGEAAYSLYSEWNDIELKTTVGIQARHDAIDNGLFSSRARSRLQAFAEADILETRIGAYAKEEITWTPWLSTELGIRGDVFSFDVRSNEATGAEQAAIISPKASVVIAPTTGTEFFASFGMGFHSNDARGVVRTVDPVKPLTRAVGYEVGGRTRLFDRLDLASSVFLMDLESEIVFVGDEGTTEESGRTRRMGLEGEARIEVLSWLFADADFTLTRARYRDAPRGEDSVPLAPRLTVSAGLSAIHPNGFFGRVGLFHLADRAASEDGFITALGYTKLDASLGYRTERFEFSLTAQNLLDADIREAQFATTSRLPNERNAADCPSGTRGISDGASFAGCEDLHFSPGPPIGAQASLSLFF